jgi:hypothetical protein
MVTNLTQKNINPSVGGTYQCRFGTSTPEVVSDPITVTIIQKFVGDGPNKKSKRTFLSFNLNEKINWFRTLTEDQHFQLRTQFELSEAELYDLKQRGRFSAQY